MNVDLGNIISFFRRYLSAGKAFNVLYKRIEARDKLTSLISDTRERDNPFTLSWHKTDDNREISLPLYYTVFHVN